jgi:hypothetical protein
MKTHVLTRFQIGAFAALALATCSEQALAYILNERDPAIAALIASQLSAATGSGFCIPDPAPSCTAVTGPYGPRLYDGASQRYTPTGEWHEGVDFGCVQGTQTLSVLAGKVMENEYSKAWNGYIIGVDSGAYRTRYVHMSALAAKTNTVGTTIAVGDVAGASGGYAGHPHLHVEVWRKTGQGSGNWQPNASNLSYVPINPLNVICGGGHHVSQPPTILQGAAAVPDKGTGSLNSPPYGVQQDFPEPGGDTSIDSLMTILADNVSMRTGSSDWVNSVAQMPARALLSEIAYMNALNGWAKYERWAMQMRTQANQAVILKMKADQVIKPAMAAQKEAAKNAMQRH